MLAEDNGTGLDRVAIGVHLAVPWYHLHLGDPLGEGQCGLHGLCQAALNVVLEN